RVAYSAYPRVNSSIAAKIGINIIQISALLVFSVMALSYRVSHKPGAEAFQFDSTSGDAYNYEFAATTAMVNGQATDTIVRDANGILQPKLDSAGNPAPYPI